MPDRGPVSMAGSMTVVGYTSISVDRGSRYQEERDARGNGTIELYLPDHALTGSLALSYYP